MTSTEATGATRALAPGGNSTHHARLATGLKIAAAVVAVAALFLLVRSLPLDAAVDRLERTIDGLGVLGPLVFGLAYVVAALLFVPGSALTIASGALFGLLWGTVVVSLASVTAAALAFLVARYLARGRVEGWAARQPKFGAIDRAIQDGGWRIIAMLRLVPVYPFSLGNYLFGLTGVRFWPYVAASWAFMLPGTFMYVYIGYLGVESLEAASEQESAVGIGRFVLLAAGFVALVVVLVYATRLAARRLREASEIAPQEAGRSADANRGSSLTTAAVLFVVSLLLLGCGIWAQGNRGFFAGLFGPPAVDAAEAYAEGEGAADFDHGAFDALLRAHVDERGLVDYGALHRDPARLDGYIATLAEAPFDELGRDEKLALLINAYNAFTLRLILDHWPTDSIRDIPAAERWEAERWELAGEKVSLNQIEHERIRPKFVEPRIHFALVCAAIGCPKLRAEAYVGDRLEEQLEDQARYVHSHDTWFRYDADEGVVHLTRLYDWYGGDFEQVAGSVLGYVGRYVPEVEAALQAERDLDIEWLPYDWDLNVQPGAEPSKAEGGDDR